MKERDVLKLIHHRHRITDPRHGDTPRYIVIEHPNAGPVIGDAAALRTLDALVLDRYLTRGHREVAGYEVKCNRADVLRELRNPAKAEAWSRYCHRFWLVAAEPGLVTVDELPATWGLMVVEDTTRLTVVKRASLNKRPRPLPGIADLMWRAIKTDRDNR